ncbi:22863_t:CDS:2 [Gigaspora margarita]|uniref:22863_t:CDS:1 n=1 Tax=Gigaspora margarita TaxID=4874 RepID=A0ABM8VWR3_GIGMA|nr:22863_t:CDS:2 [Gigaspora margarita]
MPKQNKLPPVHPGEILRTELLVPLNISPIELAQAIQSYDEKVLANKLEALKKQIKPYKKHEQNRAKEV